MSNIRRGLIWGVNTMVYIATIFLLLLLSLEPISVQSAAIVSLLLGAIAGYAVGMTVWQVLDMQDENTADLQEDEEKQELK